MHRHILTVFSQRQGVKRVSLRIAVYRNVLDFSLPGSKATSRAKGLHRNLGGLVSGRQMLRERDGPHREGEEP